MEVLKSKLVIFLCLPLVFLLVVGHFPIERSFVGVCTKVLDGDTIIVNAAVVRLANIDAPEKAQLSYDGLPIGRWSRKYLEKRVLGKKVRVSYIKRGRFKRILGNIWLNKININKDILRAGMAVKYYPEDVHTYNSLEYKARLRRVGIFGVFGFARPKFYRKMVIKRSRK
jgi:endonuclease YncB( thermonuclease family)